MRDMSEDSKSVPAGTGRGGRQRRQRTEYRADGEAAKKGLRYIIVPVLVLTVVGVAVGVLGKPAYRKYRESRGRTMGLKAWEEFRAGQTVSAVRNLRLALQLAPDDPEVMRNGARILASEDVPDAMTFWEKIFQKGEGTLDDRIRYAALAVRLHRLRPAQEQLDLILKTDPNNATALRLLMEVNEATGDSRGAIVLARRLVELDGNSTNQYFLGETLVKASRPFTADGSVTADQVKWAEEGSKILLPMATSQGPLQSAAAARLADTVTLQGEAARLVLAAVDQKSARTPSDILTASVIRAKADPKNSDEIGAKVVRELAEVDLDQRLRAMDWLASIGRPNLAAQLIRPIDAETNILAANMELDVALKNQNWPRIKAVLAKPPAGLAPTVTNVLTAAVSLSENNAATAEKILRNTIEAASTSITADAELRYIGSAAERLGLIRVALAAHEARLVRGAAVIDAAQTMIRLSLIEQAKDPQFPVLLHQYPALKALHSAVPDDVGVASQYYYTASIIGRDLPEVQAGLTALKRTYPTQPEIILVLAMVALKTDAAAEATRIVEENPLDFASLPFRMKPLMVSILGMSGQKELARSLAQKLDPAKYYLEERELLAPWRPH